MNTLDWIIVGIVALSTLLGLYWGVIRQVLAIAGLVAAISIAGRSYESVADLLAPLLPTAPDLLNLVAFLLVMTLVSVVVSALATALRLFVGLLFLGWLDHALGGLLGLVQSILVVTALLAALTAFPGVGITEQVGGSRLAPLFSRPVMWALPLLPERFRLPNSLTFDA